MKPMMNRTAGSGGSDDGPMVYDILAKNQPGKGIDTTLHVLPIDKPEWFEDLTYQLLYNCTIPVDNIEGNNIIKLDISLDDGSNISCERRLASGGETEIHTTSTGVKYRTTITNNSIRVRFNTHVKIMNATGVSESITGNKRDRTINIQCQYFKKLDWQ